MNGYVARHISVLAPLVPLSLQDADYLKIRRIVGWSMATTLATQLVLDALNMALTTRRRRA